MEDESHGYPSTWISTEVKDLSHRVTKGTTPTTLGFPYTESGIRFVKVECLDGHRIAHDKCMFIGPDAHDALSRSQLEAGDVLFSIAGTLGRVAVVRKLDTPANTNQAVAIIKPVQGIDSKYFAHSLDSSITKKAIAESGRGVGLQNLNLGQVSEFLVRLAPFPEQHRIVEAVESYLTRLDAAVVTLERVKVNLKRYRASVLKAAVEGRLVPTESL